MRKILALLLLASLGFSQAGLAQDKKLHLVFIPKSSDQVFWDLMRDGVERAVREDGNTTLTWRGPAHNDDTDAQIRILQAYTKAGVGAILIAPTDKSRLIEPVNAATAMGIKVVVVDSMLDGNGYAKIVATDNIQGGKIAAQRLAELLNKQGKVVLLRTVKGSASTDERAEGFITYMKENAPNISVVADVHGGGSIGKLRHSALELLKGIPAIDGVFAVNESATDGMLRALRDERLAGKVKFVGFDSTDLLLKAVNQQEIHGLVIQNPSQMGYLGVKAAIAAARNASSDGKTIFTNATLLTRENANSAEIKAMICVRC